MLQINELTKHYGDNTVLDQLNLKINAGEIVGIVGQSGTGKTTLFNIISGVESFESGEININNQPIQFLEPHARTHLGLARTFFWTQPLEENLSVFQNLELAFKLPKDCSTSIKLLDFLKFGNAETRAKAIRESLEKVEMLSYSDTLVCDLNNTQRKLVQLAKTLLFDWKILVLDEPLISISDNDKHIVLNHISQLKSPNRSILIITKTHEYISQIADRMYSLEMGRAKILEV